MSLNPELMSKLFGTAWKAIEAVKEEKAVSIATIEENDTAVDFSKNEHFSLQASSKIKKLCDIQLFVREICNTYGVGNMDIIFSRDSKDWMQVWFSIEEITERMLGKGYILTKGQVREYIEQLMKCGVLDERNSLISGKEYRHNNLLHETLRLVNKRLRISSCETICSNRYKS